MSLFIANVWDELLSERGLVLLEDRYGSVTGNWLHGTRQRSEPQAGERVILAPSTLDGAVHPDAVVTRASAVLCWVLFPDQLIGWDFALHDYRFDVGRVLARSLEIADGVAVNSAFTRRNLHASGLDAPMPVVPPGIDVEGIAQAAANSRRPEGSAPVHLFWGHMWRTQKDPQLALRVIAQLLEALPELRVTIGRAHSWCGEQHSPTEFREQLTVQLQEVERLAGDRVSVINWFDDPRDYWSFLGGVDISFSSAREESFGVALAEHAAAGVACVCPATLCYPEVHGGAVLVEQPQANLVSAIRHLATDDAALRQVADRGRANASRFDAGAVAPRLAVTLDQCRNLPAGFSL